MAPRRRWLAVTTVAWLFAHVATLAVAPVLVWRASPESTTAECTCTNSGEAFCPMHHPSTPGSKICVLRGVSTTPTAAIRALFGIAGVTGVAKFALAPMTASAPAHVLDANISNRDIPPDAPPPRT